MGEPTERKKNQTKPTKSYNYFNQNIKKMEKHYCQLWAACSPVFCYGILLLLLSEAKDSLCYLLELLISTLGTSHYEVPKGLPKLESQQPPAEDNVLPPEHM